MARRIKLASHLTVVEVEHRYRHAHDPVERSRWQMLWLLAQGQTATTIAQSTGYSAYWIGRIAQRYNAEGPTSVGDRRHQARGAPPLLTLAQREELRQALGGPAPEGDVWNSRTVAAWMSALLGRPVDPKRGGEYLRRVGARPLVPRPRHVKADAEAQAAFTKGG